MPTLSHTFTIDNPSVSLTAGEKLIFKFQCVNTDTNDFTASLNDQARLRIASLAASTGYSSVSATPSVGFFHSASMADTGSNTTDIVFSTALSGFWESGYIFVPNPLTGSINTLYNGTVNYGDVDYSFGSNPPCYDIALVYLNDGTYIESRIIREFLSGSYLHLTLETPLSSLLRSALADQTYTRFLFLSRRSDETNVITSFTKRDGKTSYGLLIPQDISSNVLNNIDSITREIKQKLVNDQSVISDISGGGF
jgi:hypothetical protein